MWQVSQLSPATVPEVNSKSGIVSQSGAHDNAMQRTKPSNVDIKFRQTVRNIKKHLEHCDVQDLVTDFNISANDIPYFSDKVKKKLYKCATIKDLFVRLSPYICWYKRDVLWVLVEASDCQAAVDELNDFEAWLDTSQSIMDYPIPQVSSSICPDSNSDMTIITMKANKDLRVVTYKDVEQYQDTIAQVENVSSETLDLQATNPDSAILYQHSPKNVIKSFEEENVCSNFDYLYDQAVLETSTKLSPQDSRLSLRAEVSYNTAIAMCINL